MGGGKFKSPVVSALQMFGVRVDRFVGLMEGTALQFGHAEGQCPFIFWSNVVKGEIQMSTYSNIISIKMAALGISQQQLSFYTQIHTNKLSPFLSGQKDLDALSLTRINDALASLEKIAEVATPWPIDFRRVVEVKRLMEQLRYGQLDELIAVTHSATAKLAPAEALA